MRRFSEDVKAKAMESIKTIGVKKTSEAMGLSVPTLYKWKNEQVGAPSKAGTKKAPDAKNQDMLRLLKEDDLLEKKIQQLEAENAALRKTIARMKSAFVAMFE